MNNSLIAAEVPFFIDEAESFIYGRLRHWRMMSAPTTGTLTASSNTLTFPADMLDPYMLVLTSSASVLGYGPQRADLRSPDEVILSYTYDTDGALTEGTPRYYFYTADSIHFNCKADQAYPYSLTYYKRPTSLSTENPTNFLTQYYPRLLRAAVMTQATEWSKESATGQYDRTYWAMITVGELERAQAESDFSKRSTGGGMYEGIGY